MATKNYLNYDVRMIKNGSFSLELGNKGRTKDFIKVQGCFLQKSNSTRFKVVNLLLFIVKFMCFKVVDLQVLES